MNYHRLVRLYEQCGADEAERQVKGLFAAGELRPRDFDLGRLFTECYGWHNFVACRAREESAVRLIETGQGAVTTSAFQSISGQIVYSAIMEAYKSEDFVFSKLIPTVQTQFSGEKIAGISRIGDEALVVPETEPFPLAGVREDFIETPPTRKRGLIVPVTREAIFFDRTGVLLERCKEVGYWLGVNKEKRAIDCIVDENTTDHRYKWRGNIIASYGDNSGTHTWDNLVASNGLVDWTDVDNAKQAFYDLTDPNTGEPIDIEPVDLVATRQLEQTVYRILNATEIRVATPGYATSGAPTQTNVANPYRNAMRPLTSRLLAARMATDTSWFIGDVGKYARYMENWGMQVKEAPANSHDEFHRDIVSQYRADERGAYVVVEPRAIVKSTA